MISLLTTDMNVKMTPGLIVMATLLAIVGLVMMVTAIVYFIYWIKHSWIHRGNSHNYTGSDFSVKTMRAFGVKKNIEVRSRYFFGGYKFWNYSKARKALTLKPWTARRRSLWTLNEASENAYYATLVEKSAKRRLLYKFSASLSGLLICLVFILGIMIMIPIFQNTNASTFQVNGVIWVLNIIYTAVILIAIWISVLWYIEIVKVMKPFLKKCVKNGELTEQEATIIRRIQKIRLFYAIVVAIYNAIQLAIRIMQKYQENKK